MCDSRHLPLGGPRGGFFFFPPALVVQVALVALVAPVALVALVAQAGL